MHITGGLGAVHGIEGFGPQFLLPNADAFNETCAAVGNVLFNFRMFLAHKDAKYLDVAEVSLLNNVLAAVNLEGNKFFYVNPLEADGKYPFNHGTMGRAPWFGTACCPSNMARLLPQVQGMTYAHDDKNLYLAMYAETSTELNIGGTKLAISQTTEYPNDGRIEVSLNPQKSASFKLHLRIPTWVGDQFVPGKLYHYQNKSSRKWKVLVNGKEVSPKTNLGFATIDRQWKKGDKVVLELPMPLRLNRCDERVEENKNRMAYTRGPFVLCAEEADNSGSTQRFYLGAKPLVQKVNLSKVSLPAGSFLQVSTQSNAVTESGKSEKKKLSLVPYYAWNNRNWTSRPQLGMSQWVEAKFTEPKKVRDIGVYWMQDQQDVKFPKEWSLEVKKDGKWQPFELYVTDRYDNRTRLHDHLVSHNPRTSRF
jgi:DUF1680 family protein